MYVCVYKRMRIISACKIDDDDDHVRESWKER